MGDRRLVLDNGEAVGLLAYTTAIHTNHQHNQQPAWNRFTTTIDTMYYGGIVLDFYMYS